MRSANAVTYALQPELGFAALQVDRVVAGADERAGRQRRRWGRVEEASQPRRAPGVRAGLVAARADDADHLPGDDDRRPDDDVVSSEARRPGPRGSRRCASPDATIRPPMRRRSRCAVHHGDLAASVRPYGSSPSSANAASGCASVGQVRDSHVHRRTRAQASETLWIRLRVEQRARRRDEAGTDEERLTSHKRRPVGRSRADQQDEGERPDLRLRLRRRRRPRRHRVRHRLLRGPPALRGSRGRASAPTTGRWRPASRSSCAAARAARPSGARATARPAAVEAPVSSSAPRTQSPFHVVGVELVVDLRRPERGSALGVRRQRRQFA